MHEGSGSINTFCGARLENIKVTSGPPCNPFMPSSFNVELKFSAQASVHSLSSPVPAPSHSNPVLRRSNDDSHPASDSVLGFDMYVKVGNTFDVRRLSTTVEGPGSVFVAVERAIEEIRPWLHRLLEAELKGG